LKLLRYLLRINLRMKSQPFKFIYFLLCLGLCNPLWAQSLVDDANLSMGADGSGGTFAETIKIISQSKKIFILTNNNQQLGPGDFISLALEDKLAARAVVAKTHQGQVGIKILKIYSVAQWSRLRRDLEVQIVKGDDSAFGKKPETKTEQSEVAKIRSEEDLFTGDVVADDELGILDENKNRHIRPDNLISIQAAYFEANEIQSRGGSLRSPMYGLSWAYQFTDNYFVEGLYGRTLIDNYPGDGTQTLVNHVVARLKYNIKGPLYTFFMPYLGYQSYTVSSPEAGKGNSATQNVEELEVIEGLKKSGPVFGVTVLRRLVPGWFVKADLGSDIINVGFTIEF
jgi:hypothetical protein